MNYDFSQLNDKEFEQLVVDLLSSYFKKRIERFRPGRDQGIDGRFYFDENKEVIIQCKHYLRSGYNTLISKIKNEEAEKVLKLAPNRYIFVTSLPLSRKNKNEIWNIFYPYIKNESDIYGQEDLNDILSLNPIIEEKHYKLWITSTNVLKRLVNSAIKGRSKFEIEQISNKSNKYVQTENHNSAIEILNKNNVLIISGEPGIGKTSLAENLCLYYASKGYEFIDIEESLSEAENVYDLGSRQVFYFDDFLGSNYFEAIENKKDSHIIKFIQRIKSDNGKKFILTTRTNILNSGIYHSSIFTVRKLQKHEFLLAINDFNALDRAKILYNHIWFSNLSEEYIEEIYREKRYHKIIDHKNYNPRLIEFITDIERITTKASEYWHYILKKLDNPKDIWNDCFKTQNNAFARNLVCLTVFNGKPIDEKDLKKSFYRLNELEHLVSFSHTDKDFNSIAQLSVRSFLNRNRIRDEITYSVFNPSITDYILNEYHNEYEKLENFFCSLCTVESIEQLISLEKAKIITNKAYNKILERLFYDSINKRKNSDYLIYISYLFKNDSMKNKYIIELIDFIINNNEFYEVVKLIELIIDNHKKIEFSNYNFLLNNIDNEEYEVEDIIVLINFIDKINIKDYEVLDSISEIVTEILRIEADKIKNYVDLESTIQYYGEDGDSEFEVNESAIRDHIVEGLKDIVKEVGEDFTDRFDIELYDIALDIDIDDLISDYFDSLRYEKEEHGYRGSTKIDASGAIDDLFERS